MTGTFPLLWLPIMQAKKPSPSIAAFHLIPKPALTFAAFSISTSVSVKNRDQRQLPIYAEPERYKFILFSEPLKRFHRRLEEAEDAEFLSPFSEGRFCADVLNPDLPVDNKVVEPLSRKRRYCLILLHQDGSTEKHMRPINHFKPHMQRFFQSSLQMPPLKHEMAALPSIIFRPA